MSRASRLSFAAQLSRINLAGARLGYRLAGVLVPATAVLDFVLYPAEAPGLLGIRVVASVAAFGLLALTFVPRAQRYPVVLGAGPPLLCAVAIQAIIARVGGAASPYYAGLILCILAAAVLYTWRWQQTLVVGLAILLVWLLPALHQAAEAGLEFRPFFNNLFFLVLTIVITVTAAAKRYRASYQGHLARTTLAETSGQLATTLERLQQLDRLKNEFFANVSHELRTPLTLILAPVEDLLLREPPPAARQSLLIVRRNGQRLLRLVDDLLDLARLDAGGFRLRISELNLPELARRVVEAARPTAESRSMDLRFESDGSDPDLCGDAHRLEIVLTNLVANALKFTPDGGRISVRTSSGPDFATVEVTDTGAGIAASELERIFDRFYQVEGTERRQQGGAGIGLSLARRLSELHGGSIHVQSEVGVGSSFIVELPLGREHFRDEVIERRRVRVDHHPGRRAEDRAANEALTTASADAVHGLPVEAVRLDGGRRARVLVAEDEPDLRAFIRSSLEGHFDVLTANNGADALQRIEKERPDLLLTDLMMPGLSGTDLCRSVKQNQLLRSTPVIVLTALSSTDTILDCYSADADDFVTKPFHPRVLVARINAQLRLRALSLKLADQSRLSMAGSLAAGIAHEVKNPLNAVLNAARTLPAMGQRPELAAKLLRIIEEGALRIQDVVSSLELHVRPAEGDGMVACDLHAGLESSLRLLEHRMDGVNVHAQFRSSRTVIASARALNQVFLNLLDNAVKAAPNNIWVSLADTDRSVRVLIEDDGPGVDPEDVSLIFEPFFTRRPAGEGTGLGLYLCQRIVRDFGGELYYRPRDGGGAAFVVDLPSQEAA